MDIETAIYTYNGHYSAIKRNEVSKHSLTWMNLKNIMPNKRGQTDTKGHISYDSIYMKHS